LVTASDISRDAGLVFRINSRNLLNSEIPFYCSDLLGGITGKFDIITANPPYLSDKEVDDMKKIGWPEPELALRGEGIGTTVSILLISLAKLFLNPGGFLVMEFTPEHKYELYSTMVALGYRSISVEKDLGKRDRVISGRMPWGK
jgi:release factor glutamine methyltransferase